MNCFCPVAGEIRFPTFESAAANEKGRARPTKARTGRTVDVRAEILPVQPRRPDAIQWIVEQIPVDQTGPAGVPANVGHRRPACCSIQRDGLLDGRVADPRKGVGTSRRDDRRLLQRGAEVGHRTDWGAERLERNHLRDPANSTPGPRSSRPMASATANQARRGAATARVASPVSPRYRPCRSSTRHSGKWSTNCRQMIPSAADRDTKNDQVVVGPKDQRLRVRALPGRGPLRLEVIPDAFELVPVFG